MRCRRLCRVTNERAAVASSPCTRLHGEWGGGEVEAQVAEPGV